VHAKVQRPTKATLAFLQLRNYHFDSIADCLQCIRSQGGVKFPTGGNRLFESPRALLADAKGTADSV